MSSSFFGLTDDATGDQAHADIEQWTAGLRSQADAYQNLQQQVAALSATASSQDKTVEATVDSSGILTDLWVSDRLAPCAGSRISANVLSAVQRAQARLADSVQDLTDITLSSGDSGGEAIVSTYRHRFPPPPESPETEEGALTEIDEDDFEEDDEDLFLEEDETELDADALNASAFNDESSRRRP